MSEPSPAPHQPYVVPTSGMATASLVFAIIGALGGWCMLAIPCLLAILLGHLALRETRTGQRSGHGMAVAGLVLGYLFAIPWLMLAFWGVIGSVLKGLGIG